MTSLMGKILSENERLETLVYRFKELCSWTLNMLQDYKSPLNPAATAFIESYEREYEELVKKLNDLDNETN